MRRTAQFLALSFVIASTAQARGADFYASTIGSPAGAGTLADPWDLQTALSQTGTVQPGDTVWVRGGVYEGSFTVLLAGTESEPITVRAFRRERVVLDHDSGAPCNPATPVECTLDSSHCASLIVPECSHDIVLRDLELTYSELGGRTSIPAGGCATSPGCCYVDGVAPPLKTECTATPPAIGRAQWQTVDIHGAGIELVNCAVHDGGPGLSPRYLAQDTEIYGSLVFNNGWVNPIAGAGHGIHLENKHVSFHQSSKQVRDSVVWNNFGYGVHGYTAIPRLLINVHFDGAIAFNNGAPAAAFFATNPTVYAALQGARYNNLYVDSEEPLALISVRSSHSYQPTGTAAVTGRFGSSIDDNGDLLFEDNYIVGPGRPVAIDRWTSVSLAANTFVGGGTPAVGDIETLASITKGDCKAGPYNPDYFLWDYNSYCFTGAGSTPFLKTIFGNEYLSFNGWKADFPFDDNSTYLASTPTANAVFVQPNLHEPGRAHIVAYNWQGLPSVSVDLGAVGLTQGQGFKVYNLQAFDLSAPADYFGTVVASGNYNAAVPTVSVPMTDTAVTEPIGFEHALASTLPQFGVFLVRSTPCGDGSIDAGEACDDGNLANGDGCSVSCTVEPCYACSGNPSACTPDNGAPCDDGLFCNGTDTCSAGSCIHSGSPCPPDPCLACNEGADVCLSAAGVACASDGNPCTNDQCDGAGVCARTHTPDACSAATRCTGPDACSAGACQPGGPIVACGDANVCGAEQCDDGNAVNGDGCDNNCTSSACGNGVAAGAEVCDDGNSVSGDGCDSNCRPTGCGNGVATAGEQCDDGNLTNGDGCDNNCTVSACGNGITSSPEACDDGNAVNGDGCDSNCTLTACGNGVRFGSESCDDGNLTNGDGCQSNCTYTPVTANAAAGGTVTTDVGVTGSTTQAPLQVSLTTPNPGLVSIAPVAASELQGFAAVGFEMQLTAPPATPADPLVLVFSVDASLIPAGVDPSRLDVMRNAVLVPSCSGAPGVASPDPCLADRHVIGGGDVEITVLTSNASVWSIVLRGLFAVEQKCVNAMNSVGLKVAKVQASEALRCLKTASKADEPNAQVCLTADLKLKIAKALQKTIDTAEAKCLSVPVFGSSTAAGINAAARQSQLDLVADVFGADLGAAVYLADEFAAQARCQAAVAKGVAKLFEAKGKLFAKCKKDGLAGKTPLMTSGSDMEACFDAIDSSSAEKAAKASAKLASTIVKKCPAVTLGDAFPGDCATAPSLSACLDDRVDCRLCRLFNAMDGLNEDCDALDDGALNDSCE